MTQEQLRMQMLAGLITESQYKEKIEEAIGDASMSGMKLIINLTPEIKEKIKQLQQEYPTHKINISPNDRFRPDDESLKGTYTLSYSGPEDEQLKKSIGNINKF